MSYVDYYPVLLRAVHREYAGQPLGSHEILRAVELNDGAVIDDLKARGYLDPDSPERRKRWSWRQYLANALARMARQGLLELVGHSSCTPEGYFAPVGLWRPAGSAVPAANRVPHTVRLAAQDSEAVRKAAEALGVNTQTVVEGAIRRFVESNTVVFHGEDRDSTGMPVPHRVYLIMSSAGSLSDGFERATIVPITDDAVGPVRHVFADDILCAFDKALDMLRTYPEHNGLRERLAATT